MTTSNNGSREVRVEPHIYQTPHGYRGYVKVDGNLIARRFKSLEETKAFVEGAKKQAAKAREARRQSELENRAQRKALIDGIGDANGHQQTGVLQQLLALEDRLNRMAKALRHVLALQEALNTATNVGTVRLRQARQELRLLAAENRKLRSARARSAGNNNSVAAGKSPSSSLANVVDDLRVLCKWTHEALAAQIGRHKTTVTNMLTGKSEASLPTLKLCAAAFSKKLGRSITVADLRAAASRGGWAV